MAEKPTYEQLERRVKALERESTERQRIEEALQRRTHDLSERVKELKCLYGISRLAEKRGASLEDILQGTADLIPPSWQYPEITSARIILENQEFKTDNFRETTWKQTSDITVNGERVDILEVCYLEQRPESDEGPFLKEERGLINGIAERLGTIIQQKRMEEQLLFTSALLEAQSEASIDGILVVDEEGKSILFNKRFQEMWNIPQKLLDTRDDEKMLQYVLTQLKDPDKFLTRVTYLYTHKDEKSRDEIEFKDGKVFDRYSSPLIDSNGKHYGRIWYFRDITDRKQAEEALRESEQRLSGIVESITDAMIMLDEQFNIVWANGAAKDLFAADLIGKKCYGAYHGRDKVCEPCIPKQCFEDGKVYKFEMEITAADGNQLSFWCTGSVAAWHKDGRPKMVVECLRNITEPKRGEETLRESENNYRTLLENLPQKIFHKDKDSVYVSCNENYARDLKIRPEEIKAKTDYEFFPKELAEKYRADDRKIMTSGEIEDIEEKYVQDGRQMWVQTVKTPLKDENGNTSGILGIFWDITETKQAEEERMRLEAQLQQAHKMEAIGTLAGGIAHDFNNILSAIIGYAELAREDVPEGSKVQANLREVYKAGIRAKDLVQQILAFSRQSEQEQKPLRISPIIKESLKLLRASLPSTIDIRQNMGSKWDTIMAEPTQIHEVLMNLCANAGHAMREHGGVMELSLEDVDLDSRAASQSLGLRPGPYVRLTVSDTGCGIAPEILGRIFDPYFTTKEPGEGTGMGMAIVHGIVKSHGGAITVNSEPGKGTTFQVFFPSIESEQEDEVKAVKPLPTGSERVLFVDDEKALVDIGKQMLERLGYQVVARTSSIEALEAFRAQPDKFDLVITDQTMPNMTGEKLVEELMGIRLDIPIILCTGYSQMISEDKAKALGIREFVMKPIVMHDIAETIRRALDA